MTVLLFSHSTPPILSFRTLCKAMRYAYDSESKLNTWRQATFPFHRSIERRSINLTLKRHFVTKNALHTHTKAIQSIITPLHP